MRGGGRINTSVDFNYGMRAAFIKKMAQTTHFLGAGGNKALPAKPRIDAHEEDLINLVETLLQRRKRSAWIQDHTRLFV